MALGPAYGDGYVGVNNFGNVVYIKGNEFTDGSVRIILTPGDVESHIEKRQFGVWNDAGLRVGSSLVLANDLSICFSNGAQLVQPNQF